MIGAYGGYASYEARCPECKARHYVRHETCKDCGHLEARELPPAALVFCPQCGCTYLNGCTTYHAPKDPK